MTEIKYSEQFERDWSFYCANLARFTFDGGKNKNEVITHPQGLSAKECFYLFDSTGRLHPCRHGIILEWLFNTKSSFNFMIRQWAEGIAEMSSSAYEIQQYLDEIGAPEWAFKAIQKQRWKIVFSK